MRLVPLAPSEIVAIVVPSDLIVTVLPLLVAVISGE